MSGTQVFRDILRKVESAALVGLGVAATGLMFGNAVGRYLLGTTIVWAGEVIRMLFVWAMFLAITLSFYRNEHIGFDGLMKRGGVFTIISRVVQAVCLAGVGGILMFFGFRYTMLTGDVPLSATTFPTGVFLWPGILAGAAWMILGLVRLGKLVFSRRMDGK